MWNGGEDEEKEEGKLIFQSKKFLHYKPCPRS